MADCSLYITDSLNQTYELPVMPGELTVSAESGSQQVSVVNLGEVTLPAPATSLATVDLSFQMPVDLSRRQPYWTGSKLADTSATGGTRYVQALQKAFHGHEVVRLIVTGTGSLLNDRYTIEKLSIGLTDGDDSTWQVGMSLTQWRDYSPRPLLSKTAPAKPSAAPGPASATARLSHGVGQHVTISSYYATSSDPVSKAVIPPAWIACTIIGALANGAHNPYHVQWGSGPSLTQRWCNDGDIRSVAVPPPPARKPAPLKPAPPARIGVGSQVVVTGQYHRDSYGSGPGMRVTGQAMVVNLVAVGRPYPYNVGPRPGQYTGWVAASCVRPR